MKGRLAKFTLDNGDVSYGTVMLPPVNFGDQPKPGMMPAFHSYEAAMSVCNVNADLFRELMDREVRARAKAIDDACRALLGMWVSELEPCIWFGPNGMPFGIGEAGTNRISVVL